MSARNRWRADVSLIALALVAAVLSVASISPLSAIAVFAAALSLPGAAIATRLPLSEPLGAAGLMVGLSLAVDIIIGLVLIWTHWWHPAVAVTAIASIACALLVNDARRQRREVGLS